MTEKKKDRETERVVLVAVEVDLDQLTAEQRKAIGKVDHDSLQAWVPVRDPNPAEQGATRVVKGKSKRSAIEAAIGKGDAAIPGEYRAPSVLSWKDGLRVVVPEKPLPLFESVD